MYNKMQKVFLVGIGMGTVDTMTEEAMKVVRFSDCIIGAERMLALFADLEMHKLSEYRPARIREYIENHREYQRIAVVLSGDTGFYSGAKQLVSELTDYEVELVPGISSVVYLAARCQVSWEDAKLLSLHGRRTNFVDAIVRNRKTFLLLGQKGCGEMICDKLAYYGISQGNAHIGKNLSCENEEIVTKPLQELRPEDLEGLAVVLIENPAPEERICRTLREEEFIRGRVPMTKEEVRTVSLAKLGLTRDAVLYDVGAGTGTIAIEAALRSGDMRIYAIEKNKEGVELIRQNARRFKVDQVEIVEGVAPDILEKLEPPTHAFIGGSDGNLKEILRCLKAKNPEVRIVMTCISLDTMREVMEAVAEGLLREPEILQISVARSKKLGRHHMMHGENPIYIVSEQEGK
ncbi:MAG: precorrin-6y C5,15-methyltransferase (decarboxylating) subunit CbiE [Hespellia sp.]|nr:precorrin-6y C5,15-methyltransferase (decarboxylating) subunit CbiE [Hespellia sp.]